MQDDNQGDRSRGVKAAAKHAASRHAAALLALVLGCGGQAGGAGGARAADGSEPGAKSADGSAAPAPRDAAFMNPELPVDARAKDLVSRLTLDEKVAQMMDAAPAIERLGVPAYQWWSEALHGVARAGVATVFPQAIALSATFDEPFMHQVARVIADEARAKHHEFVRNGQRGRHQGLTFFSPNVNIFRDPRWGRGHETYGEDPFLSGRLAVAFIHGLQGDDPKYLKTAATAKHYAVHSGPEKERHRFNVSVTPRELRDTYLPQFETAVKEGKVVSVMSAYNAVDGKPCSMNETLLEQILRKEWGFKGFVVTDCWAVRDIWRDHKVVPGPAEASAASVKAGTDLECGSEFKSLGAAVKRGLIEEADLDRAVGRLFEVRFRLGMFDPPEQVAFAQIPYSVNDSPAHRELAREAARRSLVLLENDGVLPLTAKTKKLAVIGPTADDLDVLLGNYNGTPSKHVTILAGLRAAASERGVSLEHTKGSELLESDADELARAVALARGADQVILVLGITPKLEGEEGERANVNNVDGDRPDIALPKPQRELFDAVARVGKPVTVVLTGGSALGVPEIKRRASAVLLSWYSGEEGGSAVADVIFGKHNPAGRLPITFYQDTRDLPPFADYSMKNRTYRYFTGEPLWAFGHGKSFTSFRYARLLVTPARGEAGSPVQVQVDVQNTGAVAGDEVVQVYVRDDEASVVVPLRSLAAVRRQALAPGETKTLRFELSPRALSIVNDKGERVVEPGRFTVFVGGGQPARNGRYASERGGLLATLELGGTPVAIK